MKRLFSKSRAKSPAKSISTSGTQSVTTTATHTTGLQPKDIVPPIPHPYPYDSIALLVSKDGLLLRPNLSEHDTKPACVRVAWGKGGNVEEMPGDGSDVYDWKEAIIIYGIVGILELFSASYVLVITATENVGNLLNPTHAVYSVKSVAAIPLSEEKARIYVNTLIARNALSRPKLQSSITIDTISSSTENSPTDPDGSTAITEPSSRLQFSEPEITRNKTKLYSATLSSNSDQSSVQSPSGSTSELSLSGSSTPSVADSQNPSAPIAKVLASRLSFWSRLSKRGSVFPMSPNQDDLPAPEKKSLKPLTLSLHAMDEEDPTEVIESILSATAPPPDTAEEKHFQIEDKILRECIREFSKGMYFAYTFDITRSLQHKQERMVNSNRQHDLLADLGALSSNETSIFGVDNVDALAEPSPTSPLWRRVDRQFWWNEWLAKPLIDSGLHSYILPIMQGYYQTASFHVPDPQDTEDEGPLIDYAIVSRRSRDRAGLRYQRRGIDDDAHVANFVETETIMRLKRDESINVFSYVQIRGSIPLFWTQNGSGLKPPPLISTERTHEQHIDAMKRHFRKTLPRYGPHTVVNLAEQNGKEGGVTTAYREFLTELNLPDVKYNEYDFHKETKGMKYENIAHLVDAMEKFFDSQAFFWVSDGVVLSQQKGVFRVNCIDCLDRTNVVQSAFARHILNKQLSAVALLAPHAVERTEPDRVFNDVWANNGDAISRAYAGTSALKGDYTRTGKRDLSGLLNDGVNSLARMYTSTFSDWFSQAVIDYMLGNRTISVFSEFLLKLQSTDPRDLIRLSKIRAEAVATSVSRCLSEGERLLSGWTLFSPEELNTIMGEKFEEKVLLLTNSALYIVSYDYTLEKVKLYTRVPLGDIIGIKRGAYILSPLEEASRDPLQNAGFIITWLNNNQTTRVTSYSLRNSVESAASSSLPSTPIILKTPTLSTPIPTKIEPVAQRSFANIMSFMPTGVSGRNSPVRPSTPNSATQSATTSTPSTRNAKGLSLTLGPRPSIRRSALSNILSNAAIASPGLGVMENRTSFAAFKMLPIDPARVRRGSSYGSTTEYMQAADELTGAANCREAVDLVVDSIRRACEDVGTASSVSGSDVDQFVVDEDVMGLVDAQKMTSMYAKMEYGVKRLLWLGG
ncbi:SacI homology domain-containing protein [Lentinula aff. detonsa]|uniref:SacI homology domain-containing protein n=1 Tax=Lentinula aff. detonsa TaxID=2804958 RepID=A0AA38K9F2_9AGAR|nr:SacI homology domain-containing protein [Lentinula aff. detonsa]